MDDWEDEFSLQLYTLCREVLQQLRTERPASQRAAQSPPRSPGVSSSALDDDEPMEEPAPHGRDGVGVTSDDPPLQLGDGRGTGHHEEL